MAAEQIRQAARGKSTRHRYPSTMHLRWTRVMRASTLADETKNVAPQRIGSNWIWVLHPHSRGETEPFTIPAANANDDDHRIAIRGQESDPGDESDFEDAR